MPQTAPASKHLIAPQALLDWYDRNARDLPWRIGPAARREGHRPDPYRVWLSEIMLQQTTVAVVGKYFARFVDLWPTVEDLAAAPLDDVLAEWAGLGYYARARNLHACARQVVDEHGGRFPQSAAELQALAGIGPYTGAAIAAICFDERIAVLDGNVERVMARVMALETPVRQAKPELREALQAIVPARAGDFAQAMMDLGATICTPRSPSCMLCPISAGCIGFDTGAPAAYPVREAKKPRPQKFGHAYVIRREDGAVLLQKRPDKGMLAQMTETPGSDWTLAEGAPAFPVTGSWSRAGRVDHVFTHFALELEVWLLDDSDFHEWEGAWWADPEDLPDEALPSLYRKVLATAGIEN